MSPFEAIKHEEAGVEYWSARASGRLSRER
jgi:hypothetical protein